MTHHLEGDAARAAKDYSARLAAQDRFSASLHRRMVAWLDVRPGAAVLDAGCGAGGVTALLAAAVGGAPPDCTRDRPARGAGTVAALDVAPAHLALARTLLAATPQADRVTFHEGSVDRLPFAAGRFDLVWCSHVVHGQPDQLATVRELRRVLKPAGRLALREDFFWHNLLPHDVGLGAPGLQYRIAARDAERCGAWRRTLPGAVAYPHGWTRLLRDAGCADVRARTFVAELLPPFTAEDRAHLGRSLRSLRDEAARGDGFGDDDRRAIERLTDPDDPAYALDRPDLYFVDTATVYVGAA